MSTKMDPKKDIFSTSEGRLNFIIAIIVIALFTVIIYQFSTKMTEEIAVQPTGELDSLRIESRAIISEKANQKYLYTNSETYLLTVIRTEDAYKTDKNTAVVISDIKESKIPAIDSVVKPILKNRKAILPSETPQEEDAKITDTLSLIEKEHSSSELMEEKIATLVKTKKTEDATNSEESTNNKPLNCVIVVGVFKEVSNKTAVIEKLKSLGHPHSEGILREGLSYVGVPVACADEQEKQKLLKELNTFFGIDSWVKKNH